MPKRAKKAWRKNINLDDLYEGIQRTRQELESGGVVREKPDSQLFSIDDVGVAHAVEQHESEPPKKRRKPLRVDEILGTVDPEPKKSIPPYHPRNQRPLPSKSELQPVEEKSSYDVWTKIDEIPAPKDLSPPAILPYSKSKPAQAPSTIRSTARLLRPRKQVEAVKVPEGGQSYNPTLEDWEQLIERTAEEEQDRLLKIAQKEWVPPPEEAETPVPANEQSDSEREDEVRESFLRKPVQVRRKTTAQRNKQARHAELERLRGLVKSRRKLTSNLHDAIAQVSGPREQRVKRQKKPKELPTAPLELQLSDELAESLRLLKPEGNLFRDRYRSLVERGIVEPRFAPNRRGRRYPVKYVEKYDYKHWGKYYGK